MFCVQTSILIFTLLSISVHCSFIPILSTYHPVDLRFKLKFPKSEIDKIITAIDWAAHFYAQESSHNFESPVVRMKQYESIRLKILRLFHPTAIIRTIPTTTNYSGCVKTNNNYAGYSRNYKVGPNALIFLPGGHVKPDGKGIEDFVSIMPSKRIIQGYLKFLGTGSQCMQPILDKSPYWYDFPKFSPRSLVHVSLQFMQMTLKALALSCLRRNNQGHLLHTSFIKALTEEAFPGSTVADLQFAAPPVNKVRIVKIYKQQVDIFSLSEDFFEFVEEGDDLGVFGVGCVFAFLNIDPKFRVLVHLLEEGHVYDGAEIAERTFFIKLCTDGSQSPILLGTKTLVRIYLPQPLSSFQGQISILDYISKLDVKFHQGRSDLTTHHEALTAEAIAKLIFDYAFAPDSPDLRYSVLLDKDANHIELFDEGLVYALHGCIFKYFFDKSETIKISSKTLIDVTSLSVSKDGMKILVNCASNESIGIDGDRLNSFPANYGIVSGDGRSLLIEDADIPTGLQFGLKAMVGPVITIFLFQLLELLQQPVTYAIATILLLLFLTRNISSNSQVALFKFEELQKVFTNCRLEGATANFEAIRLRRNGEIFETTLIFGSNEYSCETRVPCEMTDFAGDGYGRYYYVHLGPNFKIDEALNALRLPLCVYSVRGDPIYLPSLSFKGTHNFEGTPRNGLLSIQKVHQVRRYKNETLLITSRVQNGKRVCVLFRSPSLPQFSALVAPLFLRKGDGSAIK